jgi:hypothetical protein
LGSESCTRDADGAWPHASRGHIRNATNTGDHRLWEAESDNGRARQEVVVVALDEIWDGRLDLLLLDTQGSEPDVLAGSAGLILEQRPTVVFEWWPHALTACGFDSFELLTWIERDLQMQIEIVPWAASGVHELMPPAARDIKDARELTALILEQPAESSLYAELVARPLAS